MPETRLVIEIVGEGKSDRGRGDDRPAAPSGGVVPVLVYRLCDKPQSIQVRRRPLPFLQGKGLWQKVRFAKRQAFNSKSAGLVFVLDSEGNHPGQMRELQRGRDSEMLEFPTAVGVAHPCIEAWLLADASAIFRAMRLSRQPVIPEEPESLPAPRKDRVQNPKTVLCRCAGTSRLLAAEEMTLIAQEVRDLNAISMRCPIGFAPFADEVVRKIRPIFRSN
jgi:hypothetical protein